MFCYVCNTSQKTNRNYLYIIVGTKATMYSLNKGIANHEFIICQDHKWHQSAKCKLKEWSGTTCEGVHSLCQNKNAHSLGLSYLKRLQFHTMFDVYGHFVDWILIFLQTLYTNIYPANNIYIYVITKRNKWWNSFVYFEFF